MTHIPRRLRKRPEPRWIIRIPAGMDHTSVKAISRMWHLAGKAGVAIISKDIEILRSSDL